MVRTILPRFEVRRRSAYSDVTADVIVFKDGDYAVAVDGKTKEVISRSTDHSSVIQAAIDYTNKYKVFIAKSSTEYEIKSPIQLKDDVIIESDGAILKKVVDFDPITIEGVTKGFVLGGKADNVIIRGLVVDGNKTAFGMDPLDSSKASLAGRHNGIWIRRSSNILIENCVVKECGGPGIVIEPGIKNIVIHNNKVLNCNSAGIAVGSGWDIDFDIAEYFPENVIITNNIIENDVMPVLDYTGNSIHVGGKPLNVIIANNYCKNPNDYGIEVEIPQNYDGGKGYRIVIANNVVYNARNKGISISNRPPEVGGSSELYHFTIVGNIVERVVENPVSGSGHGIQIYLTAHGLVVGNVVRNTYAGGIYATGSSAISIVGNAIRNCGHGIELGAGSSVVVGNKIVSISVYGIYVNGNYNVIKGNQLELISGKGIFIAGKQYNAIVGNVILDSRSPAVMEHGVYEDTGSDYNIIVENIVKGYSTAGIATVGVNTIKTNNIEAT